MDSGAAKSQTFAWPKRHKNLERSQSVRGKTVRIIWCRLYITINGGRRVDLLL